MSSKNEQSAKLLNGASNLGKVVDSNGSAFIESNGGNMSLLELVEAPHPENAVIVFGHNTRLLVMLISTLCLSFVMANSLALNFTVICMKEDYQNGTVAADRFMFDDRERGWLFSAIAIGTLIGTLPITYLTSANGVRNTFTAYGVVSAVSTLLIPFASEAGFMLVFVMRVLQGFAVATSFPAMGSIIAEWSTLKRSGTYVAWLSCHLQLGPIFSMPVSGALCESRFGWPAVYYLQGCFTLILFIIFFAFYRDSPAIHRNVSQKELEKIQRDKQIKVLAVGEKDRIPYKSILTDWSVLGCFVSGLGGCFGFQIFMQYGPLFLNKVLGFDVQNTGFAAAAPYVFAMLVKIVAGPCSDSVPYLNDKWRVIMFATVSQFFMSACFIALAFMPSGYNGLAQLCFTGAIVFSGLNCVGVAKSSQLISGRFVHFIMALNSFANSCIVLFLPAFVSFMAPTNSKAEWARIFIFIATVVIIVTIFFDFTAEATPRSWASSESVPSTDKVFTGRDEEDNNVKSAEKVAFQ